MQTCDILPNVDHFQHVWCLNLYIWACGFYGVYKRHEKGAKDPKQPFEIALKSKHCALSLQFSEFIRKQNVNILNLQHDLNIAQKTYFRHASYKFIK